MTGKEVTRGRTTRNGSGSGTRSGPRLRDTHPVGSPRRLVSPFAPGTHYTPPHTVRPPLVPGVGYGTVRPLLHFPTLRPGCNPFLTSSLGSRGRTLGPSPFKPSLSDPRYGTTGPGTLQDHPSSVPGQIPSLVCRYSGVLPVLRVALSSLSPVSWTSQEPDESGSARHVRLGLPSSEGVGPLGLRVDGILPIKVPRRDEDHGLHTHRKSYFVPVSLVEQTSDRNL